MPKLWSRTIENHRREVHEAILDTTAALVEERGLLGVTMSQIAEETGIGRATLYKYFPDVQAILRAWHERQISHHLQELTDARDRAEDPLGRLAEVLAAFARIAHESRGHRDSELAAVLHRHDEVKQAESQLRKMLCMLLAEAQTVGAVRNDVSADELGGYCMHALSAAATLPSKSALQRLVDVTMAGLRPQG